MSEKTIVKHRTDHLEDNETEKKPSLIVLEGIYVGEVFQLDQDVMVLGRDREANIVIMEDGVSRQHARFEVSGAQVVTVMDLGSTNGTLVNGQPIKQNMLLGDGDKIQIGDVLLKFSYQDQIDVSHHASMREMAMKDPLTQVYNRRYFMDLFHREVSYANRMKQPLTCILFDLDHFKKVNDTYGHQAGDLVLKMVAAAVSEELRVYDAFARYGGEEFILMLRTTALDNAAKLAERLRDKVERLVIDFEGEIIPVTVSMGISTMNLDEIVMPNEIIQAADDNLYKAKEAGRNRIVAS